MNVISWDNRILHQTIKSNEAFLRSLDETVFPIMVRIKSTTFYYRYHPGFAIVANCASISSKEFKKLVTEKRRVMDFKKDIKDILDEK